MRRETYSRAVRQYAYRQLYQFNMIAPIRCSVQARWGRTLEGSNVYSIDGPPHIRLHWGRTIREMDLSA